MTKRLHVIIKVLIKQLMVLFSGIGQGLIVLRLGLVNRIICLNMVDLEITSLNSGVDQDTNCLTAIFIIICAPAQEHAHTM